MEIDMSGFAKSIDSSINQAKEIYEEQLKSKPQRKRQEAIKRKKETQKMIQRIMAEMKGDVIGKYWFEGMIFNGKQTVVSLQKPMELHHPHEFRNVDWPEVIAFFVKFFQTISYAVEVNEITKRYGTFEHDYTLIELNKK